MTAATVGAGGLAPTRSAGSADLAITRRSFRQVRIGAVIWALVFGGLVASSAVTYVSTFPTEASRREIAATTGQDAGISILLGPITSIDTVGGYTVYKCFVTITTIGAIWALLAATRLLRGEEDTGRWQLSLAGSTRASSATLATIAGLGTAVAVVFAGTTLLTALVGRDPSIGFSLLDSVVYGLSITIAPAVFLGVGAVTSQLGRSRRLATGLGMAVFGIAFVIRMLGDSGPATKWMLWLTPFGWTERVRPITENDLRPLVLAAVVVAALIVLAVRLADQRDVGAGVLAGDDVAEARPFGLGSSLALTLRLELPVLVAWLAGVAGAALAFGIIAKIAIGTVPESMTDLLGKLGIEGTFLRQFLGVAYLMMGAIVCLLPASQVGASASEETTGRLVALLAQPVRRVSHFGGQLLVASGAVALAGVLTGLCVWIGAASQGAALGFGSMVGAGLNLVPTALLVLGLGAIARVLAPRFATTVVYAVVVWSFVVDLVASLMTDTSSLERLSLFHYVSPAPAAAIDVGAVVVTTAVALVLMAVAVALFTRRDVRAA